jgi:hypothetical protein
MKLSQGVTSVVSALMLSFWIGCQPTTVKPPSDEPPLPRPTGLETPQDLVLSKAVKESLLAEKTVNLTRVVVESSKGTVYLSGVVSSLDARERAVKIAWKVKGVQAVMNHLQVGD